jgi:AcrR family transcriptional regulator
MRADAKRNHERLLDAAVKTILEIGAEPPLDAIARRAGVGIGTLYRHFADRESLLNTVAERVLDQAAAAAEHALTEAPDGYDALRRYMHAAVDRGVGVLNLIHPLLGGPPWPAQRTRMAAFLGAILERGKQETLIRDEVGIPDVVFAIIRFSRPVAVGLSRPDERAIAHRHLDIYVDGLGVTDHAGTPLADVSKLRGSWFHEARGEPLRGHEPDQFEPT